MDSTVSDEGKNGETVGRDYSALGSGEIRQLRVQSEAKHLKRTLASASGAYHSLLQGQGCLDLHDQDKAHQMDQNSRRRKDAGGLSLALAGHRRARDRGAKLVGSICGALLGGSER
jgi:hypothetical protein